MAEYLFEVKLVAVVRVRASEESLARRVLPSVLGSPSTAEISVANDNNAAFGWNATVANVSFCVEGRPMLVAIDQKRVKRRRR
jgi:hypothetical protein